MTALTAVASYLPETRVPIGELAGALELGERGIRLFQRFHGLSEVCQEPDGDLAALLGHALDNLVELRGQEHRVRYVLYARAIAVGVPYPLNPLHEVAARFGLGHAITFTVTHHSCASALLALDVAGRLLATDDDPQALAVVLAGEKTFTKDARLVPETSIFGEGASACLVAADGPRDRLLSYVSNLRGDFDSWQQDPVEVATRYTKEYPECLAEVVLAAVAEAGLQLSGISLILPHNVNSVSWRRLCKRIEYPLEQVLLDNVAHTGHCFAADAFINYRTAAEAGRLLPGQRYLIAAAGLGATFSAMVFEH